MFRITTAFLPSYKVRLSISFYLDRFPQIYFMFYYVLNR